MSRLSAEVLIPLESDHDKTVLQSYPATFDNTDPADYGFMLIILAINS
jgi:hypothetical protein